MTNQQISSLPKTARLFAALGLTLSASLFVYPSTSQAGKNGGAIPAELQGEWLYGRISSIQYQDQITGQSAAPNGSSDRFLVAANGSYQRQRLIQINTYNCASNLFIQEKGKVSADDRQLTFQPTESSSKGQICNTGRTYSGKNTAKPETYAWSISKNEYGQEVLLLQTTDGQGQAHYGRPQ
ncbi:MAG: hypothetical protein RMX68_025110 [Aulosira sp. ZfuVER01]|nr:hypothetical protein [Aulosira sp. ZfuVER01]MDZ7999406.1 hypothetical protein [Aulosira sp. DedVER01a]MDZ8055409.1 hypothetical protein [Aulosira sp. ZfuCHP01]